MWVSQFHRFASVDPSRCYQWLLLVPLRQLTNFETCPLPSGGGCEAMRSDGKTIRLPHMNSIITRMPKTSATTWLIYNDFASKPLLGFFHLKVMAGQSLKKDGQTWPKAQVTSLVSHLPMPSPKHSGLKLGQKRTLDFQNHVSRTGILPYIYWRKMGKRDPRLKSPP